MYLYAELFDQYANAIYNCLVCAMCSSQCVALCYEQQASLCNYALDATSKGNLRTVKTERGTEYEYTQWRALLWVIQSVWATTIRTHGDLDFIPWLDTAQLLHFIYLNTRSNRLCYAHFMDIILLRCLCLVLILLLSCYEFFQRFC